MDRVENTVSNSISIPACVSFAVGTCLPSRCLETALVYLLNSRSLHSNGSTRYIAPSLRLFVSNGLQAYRHFFSEGCAWSHLPPCSSFFHGVYSPTAPAAPSLRPLVPSGSLIGCQSVQVYHRHPAFPIGGGKTT
jgi:hypothetical protein